MSDTAEETGRIGQREEPEAVVFTPHWPMGIQQGEFYEARCDDERDGPKLNVLVGPDGDVYVGFNYLAPPESGRESYFGSIRVRTLMGGGRQCNTRQALLWLAEAIRRDAAGIEPPYRRALALLEDR